MNRFFATILRSLARKTSVKTRSARPYRCHLDVLEDRTLLDENYCTIIGLPQPFRFFVAQLISRSREKLAKANYALMGGGSPILPETVKQADALEAAIAKRVTNVTFKCFPAMRYWTPFVEDAAKAALVSCGFLAPPGLHPDEGQPFLKDGVEAGMWFLERRADGTDAVPGRWANWPFVAGSFDGPPRR